MAFVYALSIENLHATDLHRERVMDLAALGSDNVEYHMLETELESQMAELDSYNMREAEESSLFQLHEDQERVKFDGSSMDVPRAASLLSFKESTMALEPEWEPIAMCLVVAMFMLLPQILMT